VLLSAGIAAGLAGRRLVYTWSVTPSFAARFGDLWEDVAPRLPDRAAPVLKAATALRLPGVRRLDQSAPAATGTAPVLFACTSEVFRTPDGTEVDWRASLPRLVLQRELADEARAFHAGHLAGRPYVGVQVRANSAHRQTAEASPVEWFVERMSQIRRERPETAFFLSCDSPEATRHIASAVRGVLSLQDKGGFNSRRGLQAAVVDLYLLAASQRIVAPHWSSFAEMAQALSPGIPFETSRAPWWGPEEVGVAHDPTRPWLRDDL